MGTREASFLLGISRQRLLVLPAITIHPGSIIYDLAPG